MVFFADSPTCFAKLPICDEYLYSQQQLTCASTVLPEIGGCDPSTIGNGVCDDGCNSGGCEYDRGDCCAVNLELRSMPACAASWNTSTAAWGGSIGDTSCNEECWNNFCLQDGGDCTFCTEPWWERIMNFALKTRNFVLKTRNFEIKTRNFVFK